MHARDRRRFLSLLGAGGLSAFAARSHPVARAATSGAAPLRLLLLYHPNGTEMPSWRCPGSETGFTFSPILKPLEPHRDDLIILNGVSNVAQFERNSFDTPGGVDEHVGGMNTLWTHHLKNLQGEATGPSLDVAVGRATQARWGATIPFFNFGVKTSQMAPQYRRNSYTEASTPLYPVDNPVDSFTRLFSQIMGGGGTSQADLAARKAALEAAWTRKKSLLGAVSTSLAHLRDRLGTAHSQAVASHLEAIAEIENRLVKPDANASPPARYSVPTRPVLPSDAIADASVPALTDLTFQLIARAFQCNVVPAATFNFFTSGTSTTMPWAGLPGLHNDVSHPRGASTERTKAHTWYATKFAELVTLLKNTPSTAGGSVFDETLIVWGTCHDVTNYLPTRRHRCDNLPFVVMGGKNVPFRKGRYVSIGANATSVAYQNASLGSLLLSVGNACGLNAAKFGDPRLCPGPMAALG